MAGNSRDLSPAKSDQLKYRSPNRKSRYKEERTIALLKEVDAAGQGDDGSFLGRSPGLPNANQWIQGPVRPSSNTASAHFGDSALFKSGPEVKENLLFAKRTSPLYRTSTSKS